MQEIIAQAIVVIMGLMVTILGLAIPYLLWRYDLFTFTFMKEEPVLRDLYLYDSCFGFCRTDADWKLLGSEWYRSDKFCKSVKERS